MATQYDVTSMLKELRAIGIEPMYNTYEYVLDCYNQFIVNKSSYIEREVYVTILFAPENQGLRNQYLWRK